MSTPIIDAFGEIDYLFEGQSARTRPLTAGTNHLVGAMDFLLYLTFSEVTPSVLMFEEGVEASNAAGTPPASVVPSRDSELRKARDHGPQPGRGVPRPARGAGARAASARGCDLLRKLFPACAGRVGPRCSR